MYHILVFRVFTVLGSWFIFSWNSARIEVTAEKQNSIQYYVSQVYIFLQEAPLVLGF